jgi:hypothetical protein
MRPDSIKYTAVSTPLGLYEWLVMPQGLRNAPSVQQRCMTGHYVNSSEKFAMSTGQFPKLPPMCVPSWASYAIAFLLPNLTEHTMVLEKLTTKECDKHFPTWENSHQAAFDVIKQIVLRAECIKTIDHDDPGDNKIFVTCDASNKRSGAILSISLTWETARPVAFDSMTFKHAELNYPVHEKEILAVMRALHRWRVDLIGSEFTLYTDHRHLRTSIPKRTCHVVSPRQTLQRRSSYLAC